MGKIKIEIVIFTFILLICFNGCHTKTNIQDTVKSDNEVVLPTHNYKSIENVSDSNMLESQQESGLENNMFGEEKQNFMDYKKLLKKTWILEEGENFIDYRYSFVFTKIENNKIEGRLSTGSNISDYFGKSTFLSNTLFFIGSIQDKQAICKLENVNENENIGTITFRFQEDNIEAKLEYATIKSEDEKKDSDKSYQFKPYTVQDFVDSIALNGTVMKSWEWITNEYIINDDEKVSFTTELDSLGKVKFVSGLVATNHPYPKVFIVNDKDEILYEFSGLVNGFEVMEVRVEDMNGDRLQDVVITLYGPEVPDAFKPVFVYFQNDDGMFYLEESDERRRYPDD